MLFSFTYNTRTNSSTPTKATTATTTPTMTGVELAAATDGVDVCDVCRHLTYMVHWVTYYETTQLYGDIKLHVGIYKLSLRYHKDILGNDGCHNNMAYLRIKLMNFEL